MAELHDTLVVRFRKHLVNRGYKEGKCPIQTYRPDIYCQKVSKSGQILEEIIVEVEIKSTLYSEHTSRQLIEMVEYIVGRRKKKKRLSGYLLVPHGKTTLNQANSLLMSLFPHNCLIKVVQLKI